MKTEVQKLCSSIKRNWMLYAMLIPGVAYIFIFKYIPMYGVTIAFKDYSGIIKLADSPWVGWDNFERLFGNQAFRHAMTNSLIISLLKLLFGFPSPIILALLIDCASRKRLKKLTRTVVIIPDFISWIVVYGLLYGLLSPRVGVVADILGIFGYEGTIPDLLASKEHIRTVVIASYVWKGAGMGTIVYLSALAGIDQNLYEAAAIDGAGFWRQLWHVTLAGIRTTIITLLIMRVGGIMGAGFDQMLAMSNTAVMSKIDIIETYTYRVGLIQGKYGLGTAAGLFQSLIGMMLVVITNFIAKKVEPTSGLF